MFQLSDTEMIVDCFAGGGGASQGIFQATGRHPDVAINHDPEAVAMHAANHPTTMHYCKSIYHVDPDDIVREYKRPVGLLWASPDCTHHSKARGGKPKQKHIRDLAWTVVLWAERAKPRLIAMENVEEFLDWCDLDETDQPKMNEKGRTFVKWVTALRKQGYKVEWKLLRASEHNTPTIRRRLFVVARRDGYPIVWPQQTNGDGLLPYRTAAQCIDWDIAVPSIFNRKKDLAENTLRRVAKGTQKYVLNAAQPFIVKVNHSYDVFRGQDCAEPLQTITGKNGYGIVSPTLVQMGYGERKGQAPRVPGLDKPLGTVVAGGGKHALVAAHIAQHNSMPNGGVHPGRDANEPLSTVTTTGSQQGIVAASLARHFGTSIGSDCDEPVGTVTAKNKTSLVTANMVKMRGDNVGAGVDEPVHTVSAQGTHHAVMASHLVKYYGSSESAPIDEAMHTVTAKDRFGLVVEDVHTEPLTLEQQDQARKVADLLRKFDCWDEREFVTVAIGGLEWVIVDIGLRMLTPRELYRAQGFPDSYIIDTVPMLDERGNATSEPWKTLTKAAQVRMCGNSVCPPLAEAIIRANLIEEEGRAAA